MLPLKIVNPNRVKRYRDTMTKDLAYGDLADHFKTIRKQVDLIKEPVIFGTDPYTTAFLIGCSIGYDIATGKITGYKMR